MGSLWNPAARILLTVAAARVGFALANTQRNTMDMSQLGRGTLPKEVDPWSTRCPWVVGTEYLEFLLHGTGINIPHEYHEFMVFM